jgi:FkbM family methyltransferase
MWTSERMTAEYDKKFIFNILKHQIMNSKDSRYESAISLFWESICENGVMHLNKVKMPDIRCHAPLWPLWIENYAESIMIHHLFDDDYSEQTCNIQESTGTHPPYCYENVIVEKGDVVIDAGAYIGDWSAVAAQMGGKVYAFEPSFPCHDVLRRASWLNGFQMVTDGLGDMVGEKLLDMKGPEADTVNDITGVPCNITTVDKFASDNNLHVDFIKSDIEGYERYMLRGAARVLMEDQPKLSIRTYHNNGEDAIVLPKLIKEINPNYKIIDKKVALYAYVE